MRRSLSLLLSSCILIGCGSPAEEAGSVAESLNDCQSGNNLIGAISSKFYSLGGCGNFLGAPIISEKGTPDGVGRYNHFLNDSTGSIFNASGSGASNGSIYWTPNFGAWSIHGAIRVHWAQLGWERGVGYPVTDEKGTPDGYGRYNHFATLGGGSKFVASGSSIASNASIYWSPWNGPYAVKGAIRAFWASLGWEGSAGYPISDEYDCAPYSDSRTGRCGDFQYGTIFFDGSSTWLPLASPTNQTCDDPTLGQLQAEVNRLCKQQGPRSCNSSQDCSTLDGNVAKAQACIDARQQVIDVCFGGVGDSGHQMQITQELNLISNCQNIKNRKGC